MAVKAPHWAAHFFLLHVISASAGRNRASQLKRICLAKDEEINRTSLFLWIIQSFTKYLSKAMGLNALWGAGGHRLFQISMPLP
jgi:hypothetical protein